MGQAKKHTIFTDFLQALGVPHTGGYSDSLFEAMPFKTLFGLSKLLQQYGIESQGVQLADKTEIHKIDAPFLASTQGGFVIVTGQTPESVTYITDGVTETIETAEFLKAWNGVAFMAYPAPGSIEPHYALHRRTDLFNQAKRWMLWGGAVALFLYLFISNGLYRHVSTVLLALFDMAGLYLTYLLLQKSLKIENAAADRFCGVLQRGGCDSILELKASKFFGIFSWSEVGFTYFSVSLLALLMFPQWICYLALCNVCCLPFTFWSIWYQRFRAHKWCTLCVSVQATLWLLFFCYLGGGWFRGAFPLRIEFFVLGATYVTVLMALNRIMPMFDHSISNDNDETDTQTHS